MPSELPFAPFAECARVNPIPPKPTLAKATGENHSTNNGQQKTQNSSGTGVSVPGTFGGQMSQQPEIDGVRLKRYRGDSSGGPTTPQEPNINPEPKPSFVSVLLGGIPKPWSTSTKQEQEKSWQHRYHEMEEQHRKETVAIKEQHGKETADIRKLHHKQTADLREQNRKQIGERKKQHAKETAERKRKHTQETTDLKRQLDQAKNAAATWEHHFESSDAAYQQEQREREKLLVENSRQVVELQEYAKRFDRLAVVVENKKLYVGPQESDQKLSSAFEEIFRLVKRFSLSFLTEHPLSKKELNDPAFHKLLQGIMAGSEDVYHQLLDVKKTRRLLVQGITAYKLAHCVFRRLTNDPGTPLAALDHWSKGNAIAIHEIEQTLWEGQPEITLRELNDWRALTISLLSRAENSISEPTTTEPTPVETIINEVIEWLAEWAKSLETYGDLQNQLRYILQGALDLSLQLRKQRAWWFVKLPLVTNGVIKFDPATMEDIDNKTNGDGDKMQIEKPVALVIFPGLYKCGDADGDNYHSEICVVKAQVKCLVMESASVPASVSENFPSLMKGKTKHPAFPAV